VAETPTSLSYAGNAAASDLTADGSTVTIGPLSVTLAGFDLTGTQAQCTLGRGGGSADEPAGNTPSGSTDFGFTDTTYTLTATQVQAGSIMGA
jgi:L,D-peptidoglycan transpeptidase YkuD (ErfK/YbiS/YcfS/YnhG family)